jgi:hypothetical protein
MNAIWYGTLVLEAFQIMARNLNFQQPQVRWYYLNVSVIVKDTDVWTLHAQFWSRISEGTSIISITIRPCIEIQPLP